MFGRSTHVIGSIFTSQYTGRQDEIVFRIVYDIVIRYDSTGQEETIFNYGVSW